MRQIRITICIFIAVVIAVANAPFSLYAKDDHRSSQLRTTRLIGRIVVQPKRTVVEGKDGVEVVFDKPSADQLLRFTNDAVGHRKVFFVNRRKLATPRLLDPIKEGCVLRAINWRLGCSGDDGLFSAGAGIDLALE
jgi:hypothetical protein